MKSENGNPIVAMNRVVIDPFDLTDNNTVIHELLNS